MTPFETVVDALEAAECRPKRKGASVYARCPVHGGRDFDSVSLTEGADGRVLITCHSKHCTFGDIMRAIGLRVADAFPPERVAEFRGQNLPLREPDRSMLGEPDAEYEYTDETGKVLFQVLRYRTETGKTFRQRRPDGDSWVWSMEGVRRVLYRLPAVRDAIEGERIVFVVEGEKAADALEALGVTATCCLGGACEQARSWAEEWTEELRDAEVVILADNDEPGRKHADVVRNAIAGVTKAARIVDLPDLPFKGDVFDWIEAGGTLDELMRLAKQTRLNGLEFPEFMAKVYKPKKQLMEPWLCERNLNMVFAGAGVGKTQFLIAMSVALSTGQPFLGWEVPEPVGVLYVDGEMPASTMQERIARIAAGYGVDPIAPLTVITPDENIENGGIRSLKTEEGRADLLEFIRPEHRMIVLDNLACLYGGDENSSPEWDAMQDFLLLLRRRSHCFLLLLRRRSHCVTFAHHSGKAGLQRGSSHRTDVLDNVVMLRRPGNYKADDGARFSVIFEKSRNVEGGILKPVEVQLRDDESGRGLVFASKSLIDSEHEQMLDLLQNTEMTQKEIALEIGIDQSNVSRFYKQGCESGLFSRKRRGVK